MTKARDLADLISAGNPLADGAISVSEVSGAAPTASPTFTGDATFDTDTLVIDSTNNRVGIGTSSPATNLTVTSATSNGSGGDNEGMIQAYYTGTSNGNASLISKNYYGIMQFMAWESNGLRIGSRAVGNGGSGEVVLTTGNDTERMRITSSGNVGIGETTANEKLSINGGNIRLETQPSTTRRIYALGGTQSYVLNSTGGAAIAFDRDASNNDEIAFETHAQGAAHAERMRIGNYGQLGFNGANYGTSGQVLTSNGSSAAPTWADAATGGALFDGGLFQ